MTFSHLDSSGRATMVDTNAKQVTRRSATARSIVVLPEEVLARLYEAFFSTKPEGMGIGLSLCRSIIESHRGRIRGQNLYNGDAVAGCRFSFTLPVETHARPEDSSSPHVNGEAPLDADASPVAKTFQ